MLRSSAALFVLAALAAAPALAQDATAPPPLRLHVDACHAGPAPADRFAAFTGSMPAIDGTTRMAMRFDLYQRRRGASGFARVELPHWGVWEHTETPGAAGFIFTKRVEALAAPATYRAVAHFRWFGADGVLRNARRVSAACRQPDPRPDLRVGALRLSPAGGLLVAIRNAGRADAGPFAVVAGVGDARATADVDGLAAGDVRWVEVATTCRPGESVAVGVDPADRVDESREGDDSVTRSCPAAR